MSPRSASPEICGFLQAKVREWLEGDETRTAVQLAHLAGISTAQVSYVKNSGTGVGWKTVEGLRKAFGFKTIGQLESAAARWAAKPGRELPGSVTTAGRAEHRRLRDRPEWNEVVGQAKRERPYLADDFFQHVGRLLDDPIEFPRKLDATFVGDMAHAFFALASRQRPPGA